MFHFFFKKELLLLAQQAVITLIIQLSQAPLACEDKRS
jgi:hypothetical protein